MWNVSSALLSSSLFAQIFHKHYLSEADLSFSQFIESAASFLPIHEFICL